MERNDYLLESFSNSMLQYLNEFLIHKNCVPYSFRKYSVRNEKDHEFSFLLKSAADSNSQDNNSINRTKSSCLTEETVKLTWEDANESDLTGYRLIAFKKAVENCLAAAGCQLSSTTGINWIHFGTKEVRNDDGGEKIGPGSVVICGPVLNAETGVKETEMTMEEYRRLRSRDMETISESKNSRNPEENLPEILAETSIKLSLLKVKITQAISLNFNPICTSKRESCCKGAAFVLYNVSRLAAIRKRYFQGVIDNLYPELPEIERVDFSVLNQPEEWNLLFDFLLQYPSLINACAEEICAGRPAIHHVCNFLLSLSSLTSKYYRKSRILLEPKVHLLPLLQARLLLAMSIEQVLENGLALLDIKKVEEM